ncbi:MAG TPA: hypothetical protein PLA54_14515 [Spirochaetota bacterium]|nr:hypothetical protein [Spirochaetota bacterium]HQE60399.1 hypothetical protein [Spirochaetota bacterium]
MPQQNNSELAGLWETELSKIQSLDSVNIPDFLGNFFQKIFDKLMKLFHIFDNLPDITLAKNILFYGFFILLVGVILFFVIKYFRRDIADFFRRIFFRKKKNINEYDYLILFKQGNYSEAMRLLIKSVSQLYHLGGKTFRELIFGNESIADEVLPDVYGRVIHKKERADIVSFESAEKYASETYHEIKKNRSRRIRSVK